MAIDAERNEFYYHFFCRNALSVFTTNPAIANVHFREKN